MAVVINGTTGITSVNGSAAAPSVTGTDTDTGIVYGTNTLSLATGGTTAVTVDSSQNVGIGTSSPGYKLDVRNTGNSTIACITSGSTSLAQIHAIGTSNVQSYLWQASASFSPYHSLVAGNAGIYATTNLSYEVDGAFYQSWWTNGNERMRIDSSGNVGIGTSSPLAKFVVSNAGAQGIELGYSAALTANYLQSFNRSTSADVDMAYYMGSTTGSHRFYTSATERMRIDSSGNLLVGTTSAAGNGLTIYSSGVFNATWSSTSNCLLKNSESNAGASCIDIWRATTTGNPAFIYFATEGSYTGRGSITYNRGGGLTAFNTTSDYRAKTVNGPVENALDKVSALKPSTGRMNGAEYDIDFFVAHELQEIVPSAVTGEKDAVNEDGTPAYQMVDKSALIPLLTAAIQEQQAIIEQLRADVAQLKGQA